MDRGSSLRARIDAAEAYDLVLSMGAVAAGEPTAVARGLTDAAPDLAERIARFAPSDWMWAHLVPVVAEAPAPRDTAAFLAHLDALPAREIARRLVGSYVRWFRRLTPVDVIDAAIRGRRDAVREILRTSQPEDPLWQASLRARLDAGSARTKEELVELASAWHERAAEPVLGAARRRLRAAANLRRRHLRERGAVATVSDLLGWDYVPEPGITRIVIVPSLVLALEHEFEEEQTKIVCVPVEPLRRPRVPAAALHGVRALADPSRMRLVVALARGDLGAQELADRTGLALTTALHHLRALADAGLVGGGGRRRPYRLRCAALERLADGVRALGRQEGRAAAD